jgi:lipoprotein-anchoring transpeptidase ErfK/SrfK
MRRFFILASLVSFISACAPEAKVQAPAVSAAVETTPNESLLDMVSPDEVAAELGLDTQPQVTAEDLFPMSIEQHNKTAKMDLLQYFPVVVVVNKAVKGPSAQTMKVYHRGNLLNTFKVSTGREKDEIAKSGRKYFSVTPVGWFAPTKTFEKYWSNTWQAWMGYSVFFVGGIATHATTSDHYKELGTRASGGCVRLEKKNAKIIYDLVLGEGQGDVPVFTREGKISKDLWGNVKTKKSWNTVIIVENNSAE